MSPGRRKILAGAMVLDRVERGALAERIFLDDMDCFLERDQGRAFFELQPRSARQKPRTSPSRDVAV